MKRRQFGLTLAAASMLPAQSRHAALLARLEPPTGIIDAVVDSDTYNEIDDQFAVPYAILSTERMKVHAIYAAPYFNDRSKSAGDGMQKSYEEILRLLARLKRDPKGFAYQGSEAFLSAPKKPVDSPAARNLIERALQPRNGPLYVITVGAPTNVASAILMEPKILDRIVVVWLGGQPYDWPTAREFNLFQDLHSSRILHDSGVAMVNVPTQNVSEHLRTTTHEVKYFLAGKSPLADYLYTEFVKFAEAKSKPRTYAYSKVIWDISAVAWLINPKWVPSKVVPSPYLTDDFKYKPGEPSRHPVRVAMDCNRDEIFNDLFRKLVSEPRA